MSGKIVTHSSFHKNPQQFGPKYGAGTWHLQEVG